MKTRFAPSPTGWMHFGNLRTALFNFLFARKMKFGFLLRVEDTDLVRSDKKFEEDLIEDLKWLSLDYDEGPYLQSERAPIYAQYYQQLEDQNLAYPCFCTEELLNITRKAQQSAGQPPRYPGTCRNLSKDEIAEKFRAGFAATLRFQVPRGEIIEFVDLIKGPQRFAANDIGDFIIRRNDGTASFMFCNAIDDAEMGVTHALRGDDHLTNTPRQIMILNALKKPYPQYGHFAMINGNDGSPLSKRNGSQTVRDLRAQGYLPLAVLNYLARLGHYYVSNDFLSLIQLEEQFDLKYISTSPARHDITHLNHWQKEAILRCSVEEIKQLIWPYTDKIAEDKRGDFAVLVKDNILMPVDVRVWVAAVIDEHLNFAAEDYVLLTQAGIDFFKAAKAAVLNNPSISFKELADEVKNVTGCKGKELFMPLRIALTGQSHGPELAKLMGFMSTELIIKRFDAVLEKLVVGH
jgi:nondiscriminating glutamyl-tRNA synthetase